MGLTKRAIEAEEENYNEEIRLCAGCGEHAQGSGPTGARSWRYEHSIIGPFTTVWVCTDCRPALVSVAGESGSVGESLLKLEIIRHLLAPVVLISACGLLGMAQYNRLTAVVTRIRQFHREHLRLFGQLRGRQDDQGSLSLPFEGLHHQACHVLDRPTAVR